MAPEVQLVDAIGYDLIEEAHRRGEGVGEYAITLGAAIRQISAEAKARPGGDFTDDEWAELLITSRLENILPPSWVESWRAGAEEDHVKQIAAAVILLIVFSWLSADAQAEILKELKRLEATVSLVHKAEMNQPTAPPGWLADIKPINEVPNALEELDRRFGPWPEGETDAEIQEALERMD
jgi:hypothetical protein